MQHLTDSVDLLFETSWEVCNKIGGIYTVLSTKASELTATFGNRLVFIGPDVWSEDNPSPVFKETPTLLKRAAANLSLPFDIRIKVGRWQVPGKPLAVLIDFKGVYQHLNEIYGKMWERYGVDSLHSYGDYGEGCAFAVASAIVINALCEYLKCDKARTVAHFDEWTTAMGLLYLQTISPQTATVFTTHATSIGRSICGNGKPLYDYFENYDGDQMARELNMESKHSLEKAAAHAADCFTAVSEVTARECRQLLGIEPQVVTPNGFEPGFVPAAKKYDRLRKAGRKRIFEIAHALTGSDFEPDTLLVATSGRHEFRNKGIDLFIDSCVRAGRELSPSSRRIIALVLVPGWVKCPSEELLRNMKQPENLDPVSHGCLTHRLNNETDDEVMRRLTYVAVNAVDPKVTIIYVPCYLDGKDGVVDIAYYDLLPALDLTVFPSYYEPWGYTPLESIAFGVPAISSDKAGFGQWILSNRCDTFAAGGVHIIPRTDSNYEEAADMIACDMAGFAAADDATLRLYSDKAKQMAESAGWSHFIRHYSEAYEIAFARRTKRMKTEKIG